MGLFSLSALFLTEFMSNVALVTLLLPLVISAAQSLQIHPLFFAIPVTLSSSMAFMFPMATPPNAIVFSGSELSIKDMARAGFWLNIFSGLLIVFSCGLVFRFPTVRWPCWVHCFCSLFPKKKAINPKNHCWIGPTPTIWPGA